MTRSRFIPVCLLLAAAVATPTSLWAQNPMQLAGAWTLNRQLSQFPTDIGFSADFLGALGPGVAPVGGGGGRRGGGGGGANRGGFNGPRVVRETEADSQRISTLTDEVRNPFDHLTIAVTPTDVTITPDRAPARMLHPDGRDDTVSLGRVMSDVNTTWDAGRLVVIYKAGPGRQLRYVYSLNANPMQLIVDVEFVERGGGDKVRRVYEPTVATETKAVPASAPAAATAASAAPAVPAAPATREVSIDQRPDAALKGLTKLGLVLEDLSGDAVACGLKQDTLETTVSKRLSDAGFRVVRHSDDDTYMYVNINTAKVSTGLCVSRYDVTIYSHAAAKLPHTESPVLLQVELLHKGGIAGGAPDAHANGVTKSLIEFVDQFSTRIRNAGK
ncbi:MAG TPA: hypothetical protein VFU28_11870 [Vicinamibacterales bacterium]|nr:hypothetical protein [Vicinamibacterales bacterium]